MRRIIICGDLHYPRGSASANYMQYLSLALKEAGYNVELLVWKNPEYAEELEKEGAWRGIPVNGLVQPYSKSRVLYHLKNVQLYRLYLRKAFAKLHLTADDLVIAYSVTVPILKELFYCRKKCGVKIATCPVERFPKEVFTPKQYRAYRTYYEKCLPEMDLLFPISRSIRDYLAPHGKPMLLLPPMADTREYPPIPKSQGKWQVIFPANGMMKDALSDMLSALIDLSDSKRENLHFHLCGVKPALLESLFAPDERKKLEDILTVHSWMEYSELVDLYRSMHFLFLAREVSQTTVSNFPSKVPEVLCYGVVPVVSRVGDYTDGYLADRENAIVFDGCDRTACRHALERALSLTWEEYQRLSGAALQTAKEKFDYPVWASRLSEVIESLWRTK